MTERDREVERLTAERDEARLWARADRELDAYRWWMGGFWGVDIEHPPAWLLERLPIPPAGRQ
jgi:hypothetical protein